MFAYSVPHDAVGQPSLGFLLAAVEVGDLGTVDHSLCHAVAWQWAHVAASVAVAPSTELHLVTPAHLGVVLVDLLRHVGHGGVGDLHCVPVHHSPQLVVRWEAGVNKVEEFLANVGGDRLGERWIEPGDCSAP